jgi:hypothetical protein
LTLKNSLEAKTCAVEHTGTQGLSLNRVDEENQRERRNYNNHEGLSTRMPKKKRDPHW